MRLSMFLALAAGLASAEPVEIRNRQECYNLVEPAQSECLNEIRAGRIYQMDSKDLKSPAVEKVPARYPNIPRSSGASEVQKESLEERSVRAQESAARAQNNIATALWLQTALVLAGIVVTIVTAK